MSNTDRVMIQVTPEMLEAMRRVAEEEDRTRSSLVRWALNAWFAERNGRQS
jgi:metal-responsive CopG/Arc/MetJ family transcriptional regulator